ESGSIVLASRNVPLHSRETARGETPPFFQPTLAETLAGWWCLERACLPRCRPACHAALHSAPTAFSESTLASIVPWRAGSQGAPAQTTDLLVTRNGLSQEVLAPAGTSFSRVVVYAGPGNDDGTVAGSITLPAWLYGGDGNDRLKGGNGNNVLVAIHWP